MFLSSNNFGLVLVAHFVGDFLLQSDWMATNKSKNMRALLSHIVVYTMCLLPFGLIFAVVNGTAHLLVDNVSSKATTKLYQAGQRHWFFVVIGLDQLIHTLCLYYT